MGRNSLIWKLTLSFLLVAAISAVLVAVFVRVTNSDRLSTLIVDQQRNDLKTSLIDYYATNGSWQGVANNWNQFRADTGHLPPPNDNQTQQSQGRPNRRKLFGLADAQGNVIVSIDPFFTQGTHLNQSTLNSGTAIDVNGVQVGTILTAPLPPSFTPEENLYLQRTNQALLFAMLGAMVAAIVIGVLLARTLIKPLQALTQAAHNMAQGNLEQQVDVKSRDEIGQLAQTFNWMSQKVARSNELRRQMTADIAHDLRTPLTVIAGYIESMQEGVLSATPERLGLIYGEIERLQNLVADLRTLSLADAGELPLNPQPISPKYLLERAKAPHEHQAERQKITLKIEADENLPDIRVDEARLMQVFSNLLCNSFRYTPEGGKIVLSARQRGKSVEIAVKDSGTGIPAESLPHIFERFYRADKSRYSETGETAETGLGLAIAKALVEAQGGKISAESTDGKGTTIRMSYPVAVSLN
jgi:signal transduction histidine kinase